MADLMTRDEVAALLGIAPGSVRKTLRRAGIAEQRGYPRTTVEQLAGPGGRPGRGARTDLARYAVRAHEDHWHAIDTEDPA